MVLNQFYFLKIWNETIHVKATWSTTSLLHLWVPHSCLQTTCMQKRTKNAVGTYWGSKDRQFIRHWAETFHMFFISHMSVSKKRSFHMKQLAVLWNRIN